MRRLPPLLAALCAALLLASVRPVAAQDRAGDLPPEGPAAVPASAFAPEAVLPPSLPWEGASARYVARRGHPWETPAEAADFARTPDYDATVAYLRRLVEAAPQLRLDTLGTTPEGRAIPLVVATAEGAATPEALRAGGRPTVFVQAGIHAGEIDGKDAGLMLLRDLTVRRDEAPWLGGALLDGVNLLFVPIFNADGHEQRSVYSRANQRGPHPTGWRSTAQRLNLNRDYAKLDTPEMRAMVDALVTWAPDLYLDLHVTNGAHHQYDVTYATNAPGWSPAIARWMTETLAPAMDADLAEAGHVPGPYFFPWRGGDPARGIAEFFGSPRYSHGYGDARHLPSLLVETHSLKPYRRRVLGTYALVASVLRTAAAEAASLRAAIAEDRRRRPEAVPLAFTYPDAPTETRPFRGVEAERTFSEAAGDTVLTWTNTPATFDVPVYRPTEPVGEAERPAAYWIPAAWAAPSAGLVPRLRRHGIEVEVIDAPRTVEVERVHLADVRLAQVPFEGRVRVEAVTPVAYAPEAVTYAAGAARVATDQPLGTLAMLLLEPASPDSFFRWGFFHTVLSRVEYAAPYVLAPMADRMLAASDSLRRAFAARVAADSAFAADPRARLAWFYARSPYADARFLRYPVARER